MAAGKTRSYRYGELASFEEAMMAKSVPDMWVRVHMEMPRSYKYGNKSMEGEKKRRRHRRVRRVSNGMAPSNSYKYGVMKMKSEAAMVKKMLKSKAMQGKESMSYKYGKKAALRKMNTRHGLARGQPHSYRYGQKYMKMANAVRMNKPHPPFKGNKTIMSYNYGRKFNKMPNKQNMSKNMNKNINMNVLRNMPNHMMVNSIMALRDMPMNKNVVKSMEEMDMIIKPLGMKPKVTRNTEQVMQYFEDSDGMLRRAEQQMDIVDVDLGHNMKQKIVNIKAFDGKDAYMEGEFMVLSSDNKKLDNLRSMMGMPRGSTMKAASINDNWDEWKNKIDLNNEWVRAGVSVVLGLFMTLFMLIFFKTLFRLWTKLGRRRDEEENRNLLKGELESIHPISIVYKN